MNPFNRFYDTEISVYDYSGNGYSQKGGKTLAGTVVCDIQPYENDTESTAGTLSQERSYKLFCDRNDIIKNGRYVLFAGAWYMIVRADVWNLGMSAVMRSVDYEG